MSPKIHLLAGIALPVPHWSAFGDDGRYKPVCGVYLLFDANGTVVYIGESGNMGWRIWDHAGNEEKRGCFCRAVYIPCEDKRERAKIETALIKFFEPAGRAANKRRPNGQYCGCVASTALEDLRILQKLGIFENVIVDDVDELIDMAWAAYEREGPDSIRKLAAESPSKYMQISLALFPEIVGPAMLRHHVKTWGRAQWPALYLS